MNSLNNSIQNTKNYLLSTSALEITNSKNYINNNNNNNDEEEKNIEKLDGIENARKFETLSSIIATADLYDNDYDDIQKIVDRSYYNNKNDLTTKNTVQVNEFIHYPKEIPKQQESPPKKQSSRYQEIYEINDVIENSKTIQTAVELSQDEIHELSIKELNALTNFSNDSNLQQQSHPLQTSEREQNVIQSTASAGTITYTIDDQQIVNLFGLYNFSNNDGTTTNRTNNNNNKDNNNNDDDVILIDATTPNPTQNNHFECFTIQCSNCDQLFTYEQFDMHVCEYDEDKNYIKDLEEEISDARTKLYSELEAFEKPCMKLLNDNQLHLVKYLKDHLNYDIVNNNNNKSSKILLAHTPLNTIDNNQNNRQLESITPNNNNNNTDQLTTNNGDDQSMIVKKAKGLHSCTMCDRKFVHATGLTRHLEKHQFDLNPSVLSGNINVKRDLFKPIIKCIICNLIFSNVKIAMRHLLYDHYGTLNGSTSLVTTVDHDMSDDDDDENTTATTMAKNDEGDEDDNKIEIMNAVKTLDNFNKANTINYQVLTNNYTEFFKCIVIRSVLQCEYCDLMYTDINSLLKHESVHDPANGFRCTYCEINLITIKDILFHWQLDCPANYDHYLDNRKSINLQTYFVCNVCQYKFASLDQLYSHRYSQYHFFPRLNKFTKKINVNCEICGILFCTAKSLVLHNQEYHKKKMIVGGVTVGGFANVITGGGGEFGGIGSGKRECNTTKYRQFLCDVCGKSYTQSSHLWQHLRFHKGVKPFACKEPDCGRRFTIRPDLNDHIRKCHTGERPYHCLICGKRFLTGSVFYQHRLIHRGERRYGCDECGKRFYRADALKNHQRIHTGEKPYPCSFCTKSFRQRGDRDKHVRARHANCSVATVVDPSKRDPNAINKHHSRFDIRKKGNNIYGNGTAYGPTNTNNNTSNNIITSTSTKTKTQNVKSKKIPKDCNNKNKVGRKNKNIVYVGNVPFPTSMFKPIITDIDAIE